jgi:hypothetical protein
MPVLASLICLRAFVIALSKLSSRRGRSGTTSWTASAAALVPFSNRSIARCAFAIGPSMLPRSSQRSTPVTELAIGPFTQRRPSTMKPWIFSSALSIFGIVRAIARNVASVEPPSWTYGIGSPSLSSTIGSLPAGISSM